MIYIYSTQNSSIRTMIQDVIYSYLEDCHAAPLKCTYTLSTEFSHIPGIEPRIWVYGCDFHKGDLILFMSETKAEYWVYTHAPCEYQLIQVSSDLISRLTTRHNMSVCTDYAEDD